jgi:hypothetical protein
MFGVLAQLYKLYQNYISSTHVLRCIENSEEGGEQLHKELKKVNK